MEKADIILVTHEHFDHMDLKSIKNLADKDTVIVYPQGCYIEGYKTVEVKEGDRVEVKGVKNRSCPSLQRGQTVSQKGFGRWIYS